jgi:hypothetical protein
MEKMDDFDPDRDLSFLTSADSLSYVKKIS